MIFETMLFGSVFLEIVLFCLCGVFVGLISGLTPGLHLNLVSVVAVSILPAFGLTSLFVFVFVMSVAVTHTIVDVLASTYLGVPDEQSIAGLLPAQQLVRDGRAHEAIYFTVVGSVLSVFLCVAFLICIYWSLPLLEHLLEPILGGVLFLMLCFLLWRENKRPLCCCLFMLSGIFGVLVLSQSNLNQPLMPLLGGLFGGAGLIETIRKDVAFAKQKESNQRIVHDFPFGAIFASTITGIVAAFMPGIGSSQAAIIAGRVVGDKPLSFQLVLAGGINTVNMVFSIATWLALGKSRNGAVASISTLGEPTFVIGGALLIICCIVAPFAGIIALVLSRRVSRLFLRVNYSVLAWCILLFVVLLVAYFDGLLGLVVFVGACTLGCFCNILGVPKHYLMGCLLLQVIVFFLQ